ncbi:MAG: Rnf-Nqr domain containing protein [bacterium]
MTDSAVLFWESVLTKNIVLVYFLGILLVVVEANNLKESLRKGFKFTVALLSASLLGLIIVISSGLEIGFLSLWIYLISSLIAVYFLQQSGELQDEWLGLPKMILILPIMMGLPLIVESRGLDISDMIFVVAGSSIGFYLSFIIIAAMKEKILKTDANIIKEHGPSLLMAIGILSLIILAFVFI